MSVRLEPGCGCVVTLAAGLVAWSMCADHDAKAKREGLSALALPPLALLDEPPAPARKPAKKRAKR